MKHRITFALLSLGLLLSLVLWHTATEKNVAAAMQANYPLDPNVFTTLGNSPFGSAGVYTIDASKTPTHTAPVLTKPDNTTITGVFFSPSMGATPNDEIAVFTFNSISVPANVTVQGVRNASSRPIALLSKSTFAIDGIVDVSGADGTGSNIYNNNGGDGGAAGPGGGGGGAGGGGMGANAANTSGSGGTGGIGFINGGNGGNGVEATLDGAGGGGGAVGANGAGGGGTNQQQGGGGAFGGNGGRRNFAGNGTAGTAYGNLTTRLQGGSGGGGSSGISVGGRGGGGGGGAVEIGALSSITISGSVNANGGGSSSLGGSSGGGGGGGILIHSLLNVTFTGTGGLSAAGGKGYIFGGGGGGGRIHIIARTLDPGTINVGGGSGDGDGGAGGAGVYTTSCSGSNRLVFNQQPTGTTPNNALSPAVTVRILDACGNLVTSATDTVTITLNNANGATLSGNSVAAVGGIATFSNLKVSKPGTGYTLTASSNGLTSGTSGSFNITCQSITVSPAAGALTAATAGTAYAQQFSQTNGAGTILWRIDPRSPSTKTPPGLSIDSTGKLSGTPTEPGSFSFTVTATDENSCPGSTDYTLAVNCPTITLPTLTLSDGTYNSPYTNVTINPTGGTAPYSFTVSGLPTGMTRTPSAGNSGASLTIGGTPTQTGSFTVHVTVTDAYGCASSPKSYALKINKATPVITWNAPADITYGTLLSATQLNATPNVQGSLVYMPPLNTLLSAGNGQMLSVTFTPTDTNNYSTATKNVSINVLKATPLLTWNTPADIVYGTPLSAIQLNAATTVPGNFTYTPASGQVLSAGPAQMLAVLYTPNDTDNYTTANKSVLINVLKATPLITWNPPAFLPSGPLAASVLNANANVEGSFSYTPNAGTTLAPGSVILLASFTPSETANYNPASQSITLPVLDNSCGITVNPGTMRTATRGTPFVQTLSAAPTGSYVFSLLSGTLPPGVSLVNTLGIYSLRGTPTTAGTYVFTIKGAKSNSTCASARTYTMVIP